jgi:hypothetical protein
VERTCPRCSVGASVEPPPTRAGCRMQLRTTSPAGHATNGPCLCDDEGQAPIVTIRFGRVRPSGLARRTAHNRVEQRRRRTPRWSPERSGLVAPRRRGAVDRLAVRQVFALPDRDAARTTIRCPGSRGFSWRLETQLRADSPPIRRGERIVPGIRRGNCGNALGHLGFLDAIQHAHRCRSQDAI